MMNKKHIFILSILLNTLIGCSQTVQVHNQPQVMKASSAASMAENNMLDASVQPVFHSHSHFANYTDWLATELVHNASIDLNNQKVIVTSFGYQGRKLEKNHRLNAQLSEHIAHDLQPFGIRTISAYQHDELKYQDATGLIIDGNNVEILKQFDAPFVLTGIVIRDEHGTLVHAKIFDISSKSLVASASKFIPFYTTQNKHH